MLASRGINRIIHRALEEMRATARIATVTSVAGAMSTLLAKVDIQRMNRNGFQEPPSVRRRLEKKHEVMLEYFEKEFAEFSEAYDYDRPLPQDDPELRDRIWVCWWQGLEKAPELVRKCIESVQKNACGHKVTIITEENYRNYISIPRWVEEKFKRGTITRTNYSDLLRLSLLAEHGGLWLDATFFVSALDVEKCFSEPVWSIKRPDYLHGSVASGYFAGYSLGCRHEYRWIFTTICDFFLHYWQNNTYLIDYLLIDYMIAFAQRKDPRIAEVFQAIESNNPNCDELGKILGEPFNQARWNRIKENTNLFKLTWKQAFPLQKNGQDTFYAKLLSGELG